MISTYSRLFFRALLLFFLMLFSINSFNENVYASDTQGVGKDSNEWYYKKIGPRSVDMFGHKFTQTEYIFQNSKNPPCLKNCPYKYPFWDGNIHSVNAVLSYLNLPQINNLMKTKDKNGRGYTDPNYPFGEILIFKGKYFDHFWKVIIKER